MAKGLKKGQTNNPNGRPRGTKNKKTVAWESLGEFITEAGAKRALDVLQNSDDSSFLVNYYKLLEYFKPKRKTSEIDLTDNRAKELANMTKEDREKRIRELQKKLANK